MPGSTPLGVSLFWHSEPHRGGGPYDFIRTNGILRSELEASEEWSWASSRALALLFMLSCFWEVQDPSSLGDRCARVM